MDDILEKKNILYVSLFFLILGSLLYLFFYPNKNIYISVGDYNLYLYKVRINNHYLMSFIYSLTSYCHIVFIVLFSLFLTKLEKSHIYFWAIFWGVTDTLFEILQLINSYDEKSYFFAYMDNYFVGGKFDINDIIFIWAGVISSIFFAKKFR